MAWAGCGCQRTSQVLPSASRPGLWKCGKQRASGWRLPFPMVPRACLFPSLSPFTHKKEKKCLKGSFCTSLCLNTHVSRSAFPDVAAECTAPRAGVQAGLKGAQSCTSEALAVAAFQRPRELLEYQLAPQDFHTGLTSFHSTNVLDSLFMCTTCLLIINLGEKILSSPFNATCI